jgi:parallel beta-helix repeat protein
MMGHRAYTALALPLLSALLARPARAADGRIPISAAPFTISAPGVYYLTQNLSAPGAVAISVSATDVTLDLAGHTVTSNYLSVGAGADRVRITGGRLEGGLYGVIYTATGAAGTRQIEIDHLQLHGQTSYGLYLAGAASPSVMPVVNIHDNRIETTGTGCNAGIYLNNAAGGRIERNEIYNCRSLSGNGIEFSGSSGVLLQDNVVSGNAADGILISGAGGATSNGNRVIGNLFRSNGRFGISVWSGTGNIFENNAVHGSGSNAIYINTGNNLYANNHTRENGVNGVTVAGGTGNTDAGGNF